MADIFHIRRKRRLAAAARKLAGGSAGLHQCIVCGSTCVRPVDWETAGPGHWSITLHCANCDVWREVRATNEQASAFDVELERQIGEIRRALERIDRERMQAEADVFVAALERDLIDAGDFARS